MIVELKNQRVVQGFDFEVCRIKDCFGKAEVLWSDGEGAIIDVCVEHKRRLCEERDNG